MPTCALIDGGGGGTAGFQPEMTPASLAKMNTADPLAVPFVTTNPPPLLLKTTPVGAPCGIATTIAGNVPLLALKSIDVSLPLSEIHHGDVVLETSPHALTRFAFSCSAGISVVSSEIRFRCL